MNIKWAVIDYLAAGGKITKLEFDERSFQNFIGDVGNNGANEIFSMSSTRNSACLIVSIGSCSNDRHIPYPSMFLICDATG